MGLQPTASKTSLLLQCGYPFDPKREIVKEEDPGDPARYGSAFHALMAYVVMGGPFSGTRWEKRVASEARKWGVRADELAPHVQAARKVLVKWLHGRNPFGVTFHKPGQVTVEQSRAWDVYGGTSRDAHLDEESHTYDLNATEMGGTSDYESNSWPGHPLILDYKTGSAAPDRWAHPERVSQLRTLAVMSPSSTPRAEPILAILHADRRGLPVIYADRCSAKTLTQHREALRKAFDRIGDGSLRPGPECPTCPAASVCPARNADILQQAATVVSASLTAVPRGSLATAKDVGKLYSLIRRLEPLIKKGRDEIRAWVRDHGAGAAEDDQGRSLVLQEQAFETLSKSSIVAALGKVKGEKEIERLRKLGALRESSREVLKAE